MTKNYNGKDDHYGFLSLYITKVYNVVIVVRKGPSTHTDTKYDNFTEFYMDNEK